jgi:hypothetical protein
MEIRCQFIKMEIRWKSGVSSSFLPEKMNRQRKSGVSSSFLPEKMNRQRITRDTGLRGKMNRHRITPPDYARHRITPMLDALSLHADMVVVASLMTVDSCGTPLIRSERYLSKGVRIARKPT